MRNNLVVTQARCSSTGIAGFGTVVVNRGCQDVTSSIFLDPFARPALPGVNARMGPLTPERPALRTGRFRTRSQRNAARSPAHEHRHSHRSGLPASCIWPSDHSVSNHLTAPAVALTRYPSARRASDLRRSGLRQLAADSPDSPAESSSQMLRTGRSPPVASHPLSQGRSYFQIQAGERLPEEDFHLSNQIHPQAYCHCWLVQQCKLETLCAWDRTTTAPRSKKLGVRFAQPQAPGAC